MFACGGDDAVNRRRHRREVPRRHGPAAVSPTEDDRKSPPADETPNGGDPSTTPDGGPQPTPAPVGTPAVAPTDQTAFLDQFKGKNITRETCAYDPTTFVVDCPDRGKFAIDPTLSGQDISCTIGIVEGTPEYIQCQSVEPRQAI